MNPAPVSASASAGRTVTRGMPRLIIGLSLAMGLGLTACKRNAPAAAAGGPLPVSVLTIAPTAVQLTQELPGRASAFRVAEVRARVNGIVLKRLFDEGSEVKEGQLLYQIDPAPYQASLDNATGALRRAEATAANARIQAKRIADLLSAKAVSQQDFDTAEASLKSAEADLAASTAAVRSARINLDYTQVTAPIAGRIERSYVTEGAYVQAGSATLLTTIQQLDRMYVDVSQSSAALLRQRQAGGSGAGSGRSEVEIILEDGTPYAPRGVLQFSEVTVNPTTGSFIQRVVVPNPDRVILPGMFVRARLPELDLAAAITVPQNLVSRSAAGDGIVMVVGAENKVEPRVVKADRAVGNQWLVESGLKAGDRVITDRLQILRPGMPVVPTSAAK